MQPRLALCGNVFPADGPDAVLAALRGPVRAWTDGLKAAGKTGPFGFGLHFSARAAAEIAASKTLLEDIRQALSEASVTAWTANAFPFGDFHASSVKESAFLPDWSSPERSEFTVQVAHLLAELAPDDDRPLSISTCPIGYGPKALAHPDTLKHLLFTAACLQHLGRQFQRDIILAIEPEPDGNFERVSDLATWLYHHIPQDLLPQLGVCWDLCHGAVVGESASEVLETLHNTGVRVGKVQISSALAIPGHPTSESLALLQALTDDPYLHQVRGDQPDGVAASFPDMPAFLGLPDAAKWSNLRVHCHVPVSRSEYPGGLSGTPWKEAVSQCLNAGIRDFELETYTLPVLPAEFLAERGQVGTMVDESLSCIQALKLDTR
ncbi:MAG: hypothetical protein O3A50_01565 [Planctomycetota bacterium]|nr:hypothetical protein [Planctomycetota bacterium]